MKQILIQLTKTVIHLIDEKEEFFYRKRLLEAYLKMIEDNKNFSRGEIEEWNKIILETTKFILNESKDSIIEGIDNRIPGDESLNESNRII